MRKLLIIIILFIATSNLFAQYKSTLKDSFFEAEYYMLYKDYREALIIYKDLYANGYDKSSYINYRVGECYLNIEGQKIQSIPYLEQACRNLSKTIKEGSIKETKAPLRALFYLAIAYQVNNELDKAVSTFYQFKNRLIKENIYNTDYIDAQIKSCELAKRNMKAPLEIIEKNLGEPINDNFANIRPVVSGNEKAIVFMSKRKFYDAVYYSVRSNGKWMAPVNITLDLKSDGDFYPCYLSHNGKTLLLCKHEQFNKDIYVSYFKEKKWTPAKKLNKNINTKYQETFASLSKNEKTIYFTSNRGNSLGGIDIYKSEIDPKTKDWGKAENLGSTINTKFDEETPIFISNENKLYFSSQGHSGIGGFDIFYSEKNKDSWTKVANVGNPINTTDNDKLFFLIDGKNFYFAKNDPKGFGKEDIIKIEVVSYKK
ncbi:MAG: hypothetical protein MI739_05535 [Bacteroidales bacterium]|nr:hypothetical protein [Bacteroidales bacterium]